jgi:hypothetical protein
MNKFKKAFAIAAVVLASFATPQMTIAQEISPEHLELAKKYVTMTDTGQVFQRTILKTAQESVDHLVQQNPEIGESIVISAREVATNYLEGSNLVHDNFARIYAAHYTMEELKEIIAFYESEVGQKILASNISINQSLQTSANIFEQNLAAEFAAKLRTNLKDKGFDL